MMKIISHNSNSSSPQLLIRTTSAGLFLAAATPTPPKHSLLRLEGAVVDETSDADAKTALMRDAKGLFASERRRPDFMDALEIAHYAALKKIKNPMSIVKKARELKAPEKHCVFHFFVVNTWLTMEGDSPLDWACRSGDKIARLPEEFIFGDLNNKLANWLNPDSALRRRLQHQITTMSKNSVRSVNKDNRGWIERV